MAGRFVHRHGPAIPDGSIRVDRPLQEDSRPPGLGSDSLSRGPSSLRRLRLVDSYVDLQKARSAQAGRRPGTTSESNEGYCPIPSRVLQPPHLPQLSQIRSMGRLRPTTITNLRMASAAVVLRPTLRPGWGQWMGVAAGTMTGTEKLVQCQNA